MLSPIECVHLEISHFHYNILYINFIECQLLQIIFGGHSGASMKPIRTIWYLKQNLLTPSDDKYFEEMGVSTWLCSEIEILTATDQICI